MHTCPHCPPPPPPTKPSMVMQVPNGQVKRFRWMERPSVAAFLHTGATPNSTTTNCAVRELTIGNDMGTNATVSQMDDDTFIVSTNAGTGSTGIAVYGTANGGLTIQSPVQNAPPPPPPTDPRVLNQYLLASDLLEKFIADIGELGVKEGEVLNIPIELFINWLVCRAAEEDGHDAPVGLKALPTNVTPIRGDRCRCCGQFITAHRRKAGVLFCSDEHLDKFMEKSA